jgi:hypothetical protein
MSAIDDHIHRFRAGWASHDPAERAATGMQIKRMSFTRGATVNLGNFNNARLEFSAEIELQPGDDEEEQFARLRNYVCGKMAAEVKKVNGG